MKRILGCRVRKALTLSLLGMYVFSAAFGGISPSPARALTIGEEKQLGRKVLDMIKAQYDLIEDGEINAYVQAVGNRIVPELGVSPFQFQFFLIDDSIPNAFAVPGGYVFIYRGLLEVVGTEGELASVIAHECGHVFARHIHHQIERGKVMTVASIASMLAAILLARSAGPSSGAVAQATMAGTMAGLGSLSLKYSRENEAEADRLGFGFLGAAGYDPKEMVSMMQKMNHLVWQDSSRTPTYLATHPAMGERAEYLSDMLKKPSFYNPKTLTRKPPVGDFSIMQAALVSGYEPRENALDRFAIWDKDPALAAASAFGKGRLFLREGKLDQAIPYLQNAVRQKPDNTMVLSTLGYAYYQQGRIEEARKVLQSALAMDPSASIAHYRLGLVLNDEGDKQKALEHFQQADSLAPIMPDVEYHLGVALGEMNQMGMAHYHLGHYYYHTKDWKTALYHYNMARPLLVMVSEEKWEEVGEDIADVEAKIKASSAGSTDSRRRRMN